MEAGKTRDFLNGCIRMILNCVAAQQERSTCVLTFGSHDESDSSETAYTRIIMYFSFR
jgi:hypothetical protein